MSLPEVISIRSDEIKQKKTDNVSAHLSYIGRADFLALPSEFKWQILRKTVKDGVESIDYADWRLVAGGMRHKKGEYAFSWDNRATYFPAPDIGGPVVDPDDQEDGVTTPTIFNLPMLMANTEYSYALPTNTKTFSINTGSFAIKLAYTAGQSGTTYWTVRPNNWFTEDSIIAENITIYVQSPKPSITLEIKSWQ